jgi:hypothetical protein
VKCPSTPHRRRWSRRRLRPRPPDPLAAVRAGIAVLAEAGNTTLAEALQLFLTHETPLHEGLGLAPGWRRHNSRLARDEGIPQRVITVGVDGGAVPVGIVGFQAPPLPVFIQGVGGTIPVHSQ